MVMAWEPCGMVCVYAAAYLFATAIFLTAFIGSLVGTAEVVYRHLINKSYRYQIVTGVSQLLVAVAASTLLGVLLFFR